MGGVIFAVAVVLVSFHSGSSQNEWTHVASIKWRVPPAMLNALSREPRCTGTIVSQRVVITACHCVGAAINENETTWARPSDVFVLLGGSSCSWPSDKDSAAAKRNVYRVDKITRHPKCNILAWPPYNDFAYVTTGEPLTLTTHKPAILYNPYIHKCSHNINENCNYFACSGAFNIKKNITEFTETVKGNVANVTTRYYCEWSLGDKLFEFYDKYRQRSNLCVMPIRSPNQIEPCWGDGGAGLFCCGFLRAILSWRPRCNTNSKHPVFFSDLEDATVFYDAFIMKKTKEVAASQEEASWACRQGSEWVTVVLCTMIVILNLKH